MGVSVVVATALAVSAAGAVTTGVIQQRAARQQKKAASRQAAIQREQVRRQELASNIEARRSAAAQRRTARLAAARFEATGGAVGGGSIFEGAIASTEAVTEQNISLIQESAERQREQFGLQQQQINVQADIARQKANVNIAESFGNIVGGVAKPVVKAAQFGII